MKNDLRSINGKYLFVFLVYCIDDKDCPTEHTCTTGLICKRLEGNFWYSWNIALYLTDDFSPKIKYSIVQNNFC